jgi:hypothetical protein
MSKSPVLLAFLALTFPRCADQFGPVPSSRVAITVAKKPASVTGGLLDVGAVV